MLKQRLTGRIRSEGPLPFDDYMAACLYDPVDGFFTTGRLRSSKTGDFLTSPEVSHWFGRMLARAADNTMRRIGPPTLLVEIGAGSGSLLRSLVPESETDFDVIAIETSPAARDALRNAGHRVVDSSEELPERFRGMVIANELIDNLPAALVVRTTDGWEERHVDADGDELVLVPALPRDDVVRWAEAYAGDVSAGGIVEVQLVAERLLRTVLERMEQGLLLVIDYGGTKEELAPRRMTGTLRTYRSHHLGPDPLLEPGANDITVDVNFSPLAAIAAELGWQATVERQEEFLTSLGLRHEIKRLRERELSLARSGDELARLTIRSELRDAETLLHPRGLGDFRVMSVSRFGEPHAA